MVLLHAVIQSLVPNSDPHWALCLRLGDKYHVYELIGDDSYFIYQESTVDPSDVEDYVEAFEPVQIDGQDIPDFLDIVRSTQICRDCCNIDISFSYVLQVLKACELAGIIDDAAYY